MTETPSQIPPAWYPDPAGTGALRWWNGVAWTEHVRSLEPVAEPALEQIREPSPERESTPKSDYRPFAPENSVTPLAPVLVNTVWVWLIALSPLWASTVGLLIGLAVNGAWSTPFAVRTGSTAENVAPISAGAGVFVLLVIFAVLDRRALLRSGHPTVASTWWMLLFAPIAYLVARRVKVRRWTGRGAAPGNVFAAFYLVPLLVGLVVAIALAFLDYRN